MLTIRNIQWIDSPAGSRSDPHTGVAGYLKLLDQTRLPSEVVYLDCRQVDQVWHAIKTLAVRGAPAIGIAAAYACVLGVIHRGNHAPAAALRHAADHLATSRPTAVNLFWALDRMKRVAPCTETRLLEEARAIHAEDARMCEQIGKHGLALLDRLKVQGAGPGHALLTHCNAGALATGGIGTATAPIYLAHQQGRPVSVIVDETRPLLQGARLTAFELASAGVDVTLICDDMAATVMAQKRVGAVITGADRIAANGDTANKIGTYNLAVLARHHKIPFLVAAPTSTFDLSLADGSAIPIEERDGKEITEPFGRQTAPRLPGLTVKTFNPAFDVTPHDLITAIITDRGVIQPVDRQQVEAMIRNAKT